MADMRQWVNMQKRRRFVEHDVTSRQRLGAIRVRAEFRHAYILFFKLRITPEGDEATYSAAERRGNRRFKLRGGWPGVSLGETSLMLARYYNLPAAGGNVYKVEAKYRNDTFLSKTVEAVRKLYFQVVKMSGMTVTVATLTSHLIDEYWSPGKKYFVELKEIASRGEMDAIPNFDEHQQGNVPGLVRAKYNRARDPYCFVLALVDQLAASEETDVEFENVTVSHASPTVRKRTPKKLWLNLDPAGTPEADWMKGARFESDAGAETTLGDDKVAADPLSRRHVVVDLSGVPDGTTGTIHVTLKMVNRFRTGLSFGKNLICVATRASWQQRSDDNMKSTLVHEAGHKVGMVPGGARGGLDAQSTYYSRRGGHCNHGTNTCVMYGSIHNGRSNRFCSDCEPSVRKLDLYAPSLEGFRRI